MRYIFFDYYYAYILQLTNIVLDFNGFFVSFWWIT
jgi:hypothetical protein